MIEDKYNPKKPFKAGAKAVTTLAIGSMLAIGGLLVTVQPAKAATFNVNTFDDELNTDGDCSLREAVVAINTATAVDACPAGNIIGNTINLQAGTYNLNLVGKDEDSGLTGDLDILGTAITINGAGRNATIISSNTGTPANNDRVFHTIGADPVTIRNLTVQGSQVTTVDIGLGIFNDTSSVLILDNVLVTGGDGISSNGVTTVDTFGGAIGNISGLTVRNSRIEGNKSTVGGGIYNQTSGTIDITNTTIINNTAEESGGGIAHYGSNISAAISSSYFENNTATNTPLAAHIDISGDATTTTTIVNSTFNGQAIAAGGATSISFSTFYNSRISATPGEIRVNNTVIAGTTGTVCSPLISEGYNISASNCAGFNTATDRNNTDPQLNSTPTVVGNISVFTPQGSNSPVVDTANPGATLANDQTGFARPNDGNSDGTARSDIGAYEYRGTVSSPTPTATTTPNPTTTSAPTVTPTPKKLPDTGFNILIPTVGGLVLGLSTLSTTFVGSVKRRMKRN